MQIWILYCDISLAHSLKQELKAFCKKCDIFDSLGSFLEKLKKGKRDQSFWPDVVLIELEPNDEKPLEMYVEFVREQNPLAEKSIYYSSINYESFQRYFEVRHLKIPLFVQKSHLPRGLLLLLQQLKDQAPKQKLEYLPLAIQRLVKNARALHEKIGDLYYQNIFTKEALSAFRQQIESLIRVASSLEWKLVNQQAQYVLKLIDAGNSGGILRLKKEIRDLNLLTDKELKKCKKE